jgi:hypothetical protein
MFFGDKQNDGSYGSELDDLVLVNRRNGTTFFVN